VGSERLLSLFTNLTAKRIPLGPDLKAAIEDIREAAAQGSKVVVLASGDPGFYGIGKTVVAALGREQVEIVPNISSIQLAFARLGESWEDAALLSVHGRPLDDVVDILVRSDKSAVLTDPHNNPQAIGQAMLGRNAGPYRAYVCENLGTAQERVIETSLEGLSIGQYAPMNVLILINQALSGPASMPPQADYLFGAPEEAFAHRRPVAGLITKLEVRAVALALLHLRSNSTVWDIGAGSGAVSIEVARLAPDGQVFAIERDPMSLENIRNNSRKFDVSNLTAVQAEAPDGLDGLAAPDAVFIGGSGGRLSEIIAVACHRLQTGGRLVAGLATLENLGLAMAEMRRHGYTASVTEVSAARSRSVGALTRLQSANPVFLVAGEREGGTIG
jgi:precorrin-6Y C5,15-methyltransferase (decarboxylating)